MSGITSEQLAATEIREARSITGWIRQRWQHREPASIGMLRLHRRTLGAFIIFLPTLLIIPYIGLLCTPRYVSVAQFVVHTASKPSPTPSGLGSLLQFAGLSASHDAVYSVQDFLTSRDALLQLQQKFDLARVYGGAEPDFLSRYPSIVYDRSTEDLYRYFQRRLSVVVNNTSEVTTLRVEAFRPEDAAMIASTLLELGEQFVNRLNQRAEQDAVRSAADELVHAQDRRVAAQITVTAFRNRELLLDPEKNAQVLLELIGKMSTELAETRARIEETRSTAPSSPLLVSLGQQAAALERQINLERARVANDSDGLADKIAAYQRLMIEQEFATEALARAQTAFDEAQIEARRQQIFLDRVVEPNLPDKATEPRRLKVIMTAFGFTLIGAGILWLIGTGLGEHASHAKRSRSPLG